MNLVLGTMLKTNSSKKGSLRNNNDRNSEKIVNVVSTADLKQPVQIQKFNDFSWGRFDLKNNYNGRVGYVKDDYMQGRVTVFTSGKLISTGAKSVNHSFKQLNRTVMLLFRSNLIRKIKLKPQVRNVVGTGDSKKRIDLNLMARVVGKSVFEPEQFPALILKSHTGPTCLVFASGKVVIAGSRSEIEFFNTQKWLQQKLKEFWLPSM